MVSSKARALGCEDAVTASSSGTFTVLFSGGGWDRIVSGDWYSDVCASVPGTFVVPSGDDGGPLTNGGNHEGTIQLGDLDLWSFTAGVGDSIVLRVRSEERRGGKVCRLMRL